MDIRLAHSIQGVVLLLRVEEDLSVADMAEKSNLREEEILQIEGLIPDLDKEELCLRDWEIFQILGNLLDGFGMTFKQFIEYLKEHYDPDATIDELAAHAESIKARVGNPEQ